MNTVEEILASINSLGSGITEAKKHYEKPVSKTLDLRTMTPAEIRKKYDIKRRIKILNEEMRGTIDFQMHELEFPYHDRVQLKFNTYNSKEVCSVFRPSWNWKQRTISGEAKMIRDVIRKLVVQLIWCNGTWKYFAHEIRGKNE